MFSHSDSLLSNEPKTSSDDEWESDDENDNDNSNEPETPFVIFHSEYIAPANHNDEFKELQSLRNAKLDKKAILQSIITIAKHCLLKTICYDNLSRSGLLDMFNHSSNLGNYSFFTGFFRTSSTYSKEKKQIIETLQAGAVEALIAKKSKLNPDNYVQECEKLLWSMLFAQYHILGGVNPKSRDALIRETYTPKEIHALGIRL